MKSKAFFAWLLIPFAAAAASDCGAPVKVLVWIALGWCAGTIVLLERFRRCEEQARQRRLSRMRHAEWEDDHAS